MLKANQKDITYTIKNVAKIYPDSVKLLVYKTPIITIQKGWETEKRVFKIKTEVSPAPDSLLKSIRRTKTTISDIVLCNKFDYFITFTFKKDREDINKCKERLSNWIDNTKKQYGDFQYILVPEWHKNKKAIHFHGLFKGLKTPLVDSGHKIKGRKIYNIPSYKLGFSTAAKMDSSPKTASYIKKYISKELYENTKAKNTKRYWCSKNLLRPKKIHNLTITKQATHLLEPLYTFENLTIYNIPPTLTLQTNNKGNTWKILTIS